ncbi:HD domain-containing protein [Actinoallomurus iriomotensis]|uniref:Uncharacterized protein n=1 Tax=Actinoallomurus iriomotensis TaxID=478107 RepID=A0A9W6VXX6_9ACTN|nr:caspase family protein [Actinoallomurus iriomotensis]GLY89423.1 hypothetical protein Airi02_073520 [Actinoallomurus iriomotensis]
MDRFRALLLGVAEYDDQGIKDLPFVTDDLVNVAMALESRGFSTDIPGDGGRLGQIRIRTEVSRFLATAREGDTLLVYLSGHGAHGDGVDYLLPSDADLRWLRLADVAVPLTAWGSAIDGSPAAGIVFLVDACREGFHENTKSVAARTAWAPEKIARSARRSVAWLFPCSPGEVARYVPGEPDGKPFSLFARAVERTVAEGSTSTTLARFADALTDHMTALTTEHRLPPQRIRLAGEADHDAFVLLPGLPSADHEADDWVAAATAHVAWQKADGAHGCESLRDDVIALVRTLAAERRTAGARLTADPWDDTRFALRMTERMNFILGSLLTELRLSAAEAALLVALPFVHDAHWARVAAGASAVRPADLADGAAPVPEREAFEAYARKHPRLLRRAAGAAQTGDREVAGQIGWWFLHRWITGRADALTPRAVGASLPGGTAGGPLAREVLSAERLSEMIRMLYADPGFIARTDRPQGLSSTLVIAPGRIGEQRLRERMVSYLLVVAHRLAIEVTRLPAVVIEHAGIAHPVVPAAVKQALAEARWEPRGAGRALQAACPHPAVEVALREHVTALERLLTDIKNSDDPSLRALEGLPGHVDAAQVRAAEVDGTAAYTSAGIRFQLDEERVQELLMGEQLYGDVNLAIREIYQNALDACRYRQARTEYLRRTGTDLPEWTPRIRFTQGIDDQGRPYIDCEDNGIGMEVRELRDVFAQAGGRFAELPEFIEEQAEWEALKDPVRLYPNSQFGIGVLSYFMLADEITVTTCRLGRDGTPGRRLRVSIAGPGTLFHIQSHGPGTDAGTVVRLHLRTTGDQSPVSCTVILSQVLRYSEFRTDAADGAFVERWEPRRLRDSRDDALHPVEGTSVWWCDGQGAVLADGLNTLEDCFGVIVNLTGENTPQLSVDRTRLLESARNRKILTRVLSGAVHVFAEPDRAFPTFDWLCEFAEEQPVVADLAFHTIVESGRALTPCGWDLDTTALGLFAPDRHLMRPHRSYRRPEYALRSQARRRETRGAEPLPDHLVAWRVAAIESARGTRPSAPGVRARPSDANILDTEPRQGYLAHGREHCWLPVDAPVPTHHIVTAAAHTGYSIGEVARRLGELGYDVPAIADSMGDAEPADLILLSRDLDGVWPWLRTHDGDATPIPVDIGHIIAAAAQLGRPISQVTDRLEAFGFTMPAEPPGTDNAEPADRILLSRHLEGGAPWLRRYDEAGRPIQVPAGHVIAAAAQLNRDVGRVAARLAEFGFTVPDDLVDGGPVPPEDRRLISQSLDGRPPMRSGTAIVPIGHVILASQRLGLSVGEVARRLTGLGFGVPESLDQASVPDLAIVSVNCDGEAPWLSMEHRVLSWQVIEAARSTERPVGEVAGRLAELGVHVAAGLPDAGETQPGDHLIVTRNLTGDGPVLRQWDDDGVPIPVSAGHAVAAAERLGCSIGAAARRLAQLGYLVPPHLLDLGALRPGDRVLVSRDLTGEWPWLPDEVVPVGHLVTAAERSRRTTAEVASRLEELGFALPPLPGRRVDTNDLILISRELAVLPSPDALHSRRNSDCGWWLRQEASVPLWNLVAGAAQTNLPIPDIRDRLRSLGFDVPETPFPEDVWSFPGG